ncbi:MAG: 3-methyl-2-oxobutanoate hydroxymethyltransferase [Chloroflexi bacterium]|nr:3-methyl-2-oxobutanoate hydroxymethyltransferase [Chloroflexota bacterium]MBP8056307.1 3-methyl-2-oxobutanoate hydroxymethyltransferase [Chloroflexota bacterium]
MTQKKTTILHIQAKKARQEPLVMVTAYDYAAACLADEAAMDMVLVGDSLGMVMLGYDTTIPVTMAMMVHHCQAVARGIRSAFLIADMPFGSYEADPIEAVHHAVQLVQEGGAEAIKLEGGQEMLPAIQAIVRAGIPVMGHLGLTPQSVSRLGGFRVQGKTAAAAYSLLQDALLLQEAGCFAIVLEAIPAAVAAAITERLTIPTIGIGAGAACDGQVLVYHDLLGLNFRPYARFVRQYADLRTTITAALNSYRAEVQNHQFPTAEHSYSMAEEELIRFQALLADNILTTAIK